MTKQTNTNRQQRGNTTQTHLKGQRKQIKSKTNKKHKERQRERGRW